MIDEAVDQTGEPECVLVLKSKVVILNSCCTLGQYCRHLTGSFHNHPHISEKNNVPIRLLILE